MITKKEEGVKEGVKSHLTTGCLACCKMRLDPFPPFPTDGHKLEIHVGNYQTRIAAKNADIGSWKNVVWFV